MSDKTAGTTNLWANPEACVAPLQARAEFQESLRPCHRRFVPMMPRRLQEGNRYCSRRRHHPLRAAAEEQRATAAAQAGRNETAALPASQCCSAGWWRYGTLARGAVRLVCLEPRGCPLSHGECGAHHQRQFCFLLWLSLLEGGAD